MRNLRSVLTTGAAVAAAGVGGAAIANAATSSSTTSASSPVRPAGAQSAHANFPAHGSAAHEGAEKTVTGAAAAKARAAAIKANGGGTGGTVTTDYQGGGYEVTVTKSGTATEYHLDRSFHVMQGARARPRTAPRFAAGQRLR
jgi:hypothetical protein